MRLPFRASRHTGRHTGGHPDPSVQVVHDAIAFTTAAITGDTTLVQRVVHDALATDPEGFIDALASTVAMLAEEADDHGADIRTALRDIALGIHLAAMAEASGHDHADSRQPDRQQPDDPDRRDHDPDRRDHDPDRRDPPEA